MIVYLFLIATLLHLIAGRESQLENITVYPLINSYYWYVRGGRMVSMALEVRNRKPLPKAETQKFENYALNIDKMLRNKLEAAQRAQVVSYELSEGNIVF
jgi:DMSO/TMAO reductase YedYZ heme-binding membrane subunit